MTEIVTIQAKQENYVVRPILPTNVDDAYRLAKAFAMAKMLPKSYGDGSPEEMAAKAFTAMQLGAEVGMSPMQSIQSIAIVNGMPTIWGDAQKAIVMNRPDCIDIIETTTGIFPNDDYTAICVVKRKNKTDVRGEFSIADAKKANLWNKTGTWTTHPKRMIKYKARSFGLRDQFPDALKGLTHSTEEMQGEPLIKDVTPSRNNDDLAAAFMAREPVVGASTPPANKLDELLTNNKNPVNKAAELKCEEIISALHNCKSVKELEEEVNKNQGHIMSMDDGLQKMAYATLDECKNNFKS